MAPFGLLELINLTLALLLIVPAYILLIQYSRTRVQDYLILGGVFIVASINTFSAVFASITKLLILMQIHHVCYAILFFLCFLHGLRLRWDTAPRILWYLGVVWCSILIFLVFFWEVMPQPESAVVLFWEMPHGQSSYFPEGAGLMTSSGIILYSTAHNILRVLFQIYTWILVLYAYLTVEPVYLSKRIILARRLMFIAIFSIFIYLIFCLPWLPYIPLLNSFLIVGFGLLAYVAIRFPESLVLSQIQILRALDLYEQVITLSSHEAVEKFRMPALIEYLRHIPPELLEQT